MRIGIDASPLLVRDGGIRRYTESLIQGLARVDGEHRYVLLGAGEARTPGLGDNFSWDELAFPMRRWVDYFYDVGTLGRIDLYHGTNYSAPLLDRRPAVLTVHDLSVYLFPRSHPPLRRLAHRILPTLCRRSRRIIADSFNTKTDLVEHYGVPEEKIDVVYLAVGDPFAPVRDEAELARVRARYGLVQPFVLFVGSVEPRKNLSALLRAMGALRREGFEHPLVIAGDGERRYVASLHQLAEREGLAPGRDVVFTGHVEEADLPALYSLSELFVYPSLYEGFGLPPLEAMACGVPVLLPRNSSFLELYEDCSEMTELVEPEQLVDAIRRLLADRERRALLVEQGLKRARSRSWDTVASETLGVYARAASGDQPHSPAESV
jgi:glycosyltransferase involved in cell wall biosynthesis